MYISEDHKDKKEAGEQLISKIIELILRLNPGKNRKEITKLFNNLLQSFNNYTNYIEEWIEINQDLLFELDINILEFYEILFKMININPELQIIQREIGQLLKIKPK